MAGCHVTQALQELLEHRFIALCVELYVEKLEQKNII
jgi:hypothetical protein